MVLWKAKYIMVLWKAKYIMVLWKAKYIMVHFHLRLPFMLQSLDLAVALHREQEYKL